MDEAELLLCRANVEREKLFERYDKGREDESNIDSWEDASFEIYQRTDKFGFIHDKRIESQKTAHNDREVEVTLNREKKWINMNQRWDKPRTQEKLSRRIYKGIPNTFRPEIWKRLLRVNDAIAMNAGVYHEMLKLARAFSTEARQIDSDVNRQFREHLWFRERYSLKQCSLFNVLTAYSMYNMEIGYCQGMAGLAGVLLMYMDEEEAFWALGAFMSDPKYAMHGLYIEGFPKLQRLLSHHDCVVAKFLPKLHKHFAKHSLDSILYSLKWFFVIFAERLPFSLCLRIWDIYILDGDDVVAAMAFTILRIHRKKLLKMRDMDEMTNFLQVQLSRDFGHDDDYVIRMLEQSMIDLKKHKIELPPLQPNEQPKLEFGQFIEPDFDSMIGRRRSEFTNTERKFTEDVILRQNEAIDFESNYSEENGEGNLATGSIKTYKSVNSIATSLATSFAISTSSLTSSHSSTIDSDNNNSNEGSEKSIEVTRL